MWREALSSLFSGLEIPARRAERIVRFPFRELGSKVPVPLHLRLRMLRKGFLGQSYVTYQLNSNDASRYLNDFQLYMRTPDLNGRYRVLLQDKLLFSLMTRTFPAYAVGQFGVIQDGRILYADGDGLSASSYLLDLLQTHPRLVIKPVTGSRGRDVCFLFRQDKELCLNGVPLSGAQLRDLVSAMSGHLISCYVEQCPELTALYPRTVNTLRLLTMWNVDIGEPFIAAAVQRIGSAASFPVDGWLRGGLLAGVDIESGKLSPAASYPLGCRVMDWHTEHPESRSRIEGVVIPHWQEIKAGLLEVCRRVPFLRHVGWDLVPTADGFKILEGNHNPDLRITQVHKPLLADPRVVKFYQANGVL